MYTPSNLPRTLDIASPPPSSPLATRSPNLVSPNKPSSTTFTYPLKMSSFTPPSPPITPPSNYREYPTATTITTTTTTTMTTPQAFLHQPAALSQHHHHHHPHPESPTLQRQPPLDLCSTGRRGFLATNPLLTRLTTEQKRKQRRDGFLGRVEGEREQRRWGWRGDQILQFDYVAERRAWEEYQASAAPPALDSEDECMLYEQDLEAQPPPLVAAAMSSRLSSEDHQPDSMDMSIDRPDLAVQQPQRDQQTRQLLPYEEADEIDDLLAAEGRELNALIALHDAASLSPVYGSEDEEFEEALLGLVDEYGDGDAMDLSGA